MGKKYLYKNIFDEEKKKEDGIIPGLAESISNFYSLSFYIGSSKLDDIIHTPRSVIREKSSLIFHTLRNNLIELVRF